MPSSTEIGRQAEQVVVGFLQSWHYKLLAQNWRRRQCEIDVIAKKNDKIYFVEVKYRQNSRQGRGLDYLTPGKLRQMHFAASMWCAENHWDGDYTLVAAEVSGPDFLLTEFITDV